MSKPGLIIQPPKNEDELKEIIEFVQKIPNCGNAIITKDGQRIEISEYISKIFYEILSILSKGDSITIIPMEKELTTQQAADILNVCRPYFVKLLENGNIPYHKTGTHRKVLMRDVIEYKEHIKVFRREQLSNLINLSQKLELYD